MLEFKGRSQKHPDKPRSIDGFRSNNPKLGNMKGNSGQSIEFDQNNKPKSDGFQPQNQLEKTMSRAFESKASLPVSLSENTVFETGKPKKRLNFKKSFSKKSPQQTLQST